MTRVKTMSIDVSTRLKYYKRSEVQQAIVACAQDKEIAVKYGQKGFGKRPDVLKYPNDVLEFAKKGATSFHCSEELWYNPLGIVTGMKSSELDELRQGWDLVLDIDCPELEYSKCAGYWLVQALRHYDVVPSVKFSGNHGFHIAVPFASFPEFVADTQVKDLFPDGPRRIALFLQEKIREFLAKMLLEKDSVAVIAEKVGKEQSELFAQSRFDPFAVLDIDTVLISSRHLYRMPWSLNEKSGLASVVISPDAILSFDKYSALPSIVEVKGSFLDPDMVVPGSAKRLFVEAFDFQPKIEQVVVEKERKEFEPIEDAIEEGLFPPCIKKIAGGLEDGKKRALLILINFLSSVGWSQEMMEDYINRWNERNVEPLREVYIKGQLRYNKMQKKRAPPPNCDNEAYMKGIGVCVPDEFCARIKNPVSYSIRKNFFVQRQAPKKKQNPKHHSTEKDKKEKKKLQEETADATSQEAM